jgi:hypothetical protein
MKKTPSQERKKRQEFWRKFSSKKSRQKSKKTQKKIQTSGESQHT